MVVEVFASKFNKPKASIVGRLVKERIYISRASFSEVTKGRPETKASLARRLENNFNIGPLDGLDKAPKLVLLKMLQWFKDNDVNK